ncbi:MAG: ABC transporter substrate-binding protein [Alphaproteobacteria bacterium]|nr:ABC transporter substrate-binding protein [Alphaproteobacteria bacterium]
MTHYRLIPDPMDKTRIMIRYVMIALVAGLAWPAAAKPQRIVSTNVCADQLALALVDRERIVSVSNLAIEPQISNYAEAARGIPVNHARAEEIVELKPDLVLGDVYTGAHANRLAETLGVPVHVIGVGTSLDDVRKIVRDAAHALGEDQRGAALIAGMDARIARAKTQGGTQITALVYEPNGVTSGFGTLTHDVVQTAGLRNLAPELMPGSYGTVPLELVISAAPRLLILDDAYTGSSSRAQSILRHPAFRSLEGKTALYAMPSRLWICPGPWVAEAVERLAGKRAELAPPPKPE